MRDDQSPGGGKSADELFGLAYDHLHALAGAYMSHERTGHTLQPTALVHEAYLRLAGTERSAFRDQNHFLVVAARAMRRILIDHARKRDADKREGSWERVTLAGVTTADSAAIDVLALDRALENLEALDPVEAEIVLLRYFGGLTETEVGTVLQMAERTVRLRWAHARSWLRKELAEPLTD